MITTTISSIRVKPPSLGLTPPLRTLVTGSSALATSFYRLVHIEDRQQDRHHDEADDGADHHDQCRLEQRRQRRHRCLNLVVIGVGDVVEPVADVAARLADGDHVVHDRRKHAGWQHHRHALRRATRHP